MNTCPKCGTYIPDGGRICLACGYEPEKENPFAELFTDENGPVNIFAGLFEQAEKIQDTLPHDNTRWTAALSYLGPAFVYTYIKNRENDFICYHANQACVLFALYLALDLAEKIPLLGGLVKKAGRSLLLPLAFMGARNAAQNKKEPVPYIGYLGITILK